MPCEPVKNLQELFTLPATLAREGMDRLCVEGKVVRLHRSHALGLEGFVQPHKLGA